MDILWKKFEKIYPLYVEQFEEFSPVDNETITDKMNKVIQSLNRIGRLSESVVKDWNKVFDWLMNEGLSDEVTKQMIKWKDDGTFETLLNVMLTEINTKVDGFQGQLDSKLKLGHTDHNGATANNPLVEIGVIGAGSALHLLAGETMTAPYVVGIGVDWDGKTGQTISVKANNNVGLGIDLTSTSGAESVGLFAQAIGTGTPVKLVQGSGAHGSLIELRNDYGGTGNLLTWESDNQGYFGKIGQDGSIVRTLGASGSDHQLISSVGSANSESHYHYSGTPNLWFYSGLVSYANRFVIQQADPSAIGSEVPKKLIEVMDGDKIGFYGKEPIQRPTGVPVTVEGIHSALVALGLITA